MPWEFLRQPKCPQPSPWPGELHEGQVSKGAFPKSGLGTTAQSPELCQAGAGGTRCQRLKGREVKGDGNIGTRMSDQEMHGDSPAFPKAIPTAHCKIQESSPRAGGTPVEQRRARGETLRDQPPQER